MTSRHHVPARCIGLAAGVLLMTGAVTVAGSGSSVASADGATGAAWTADTTSRVFEPNAEIPHQF